MITDYMILSIHINMNPEFLECKVCGSNRLPSLSVIAIRNKMCKSCHDFYDRSTEKMRR